MIHFFKVCDDGAWEKDGIAYDCKCADPDAKLGDGWVKCLDSAIASAVAGHAEAEAKAEAEAPKKSTRKAASK